jgi:hypothetical protein
MVAVGSFSLRALLLDFGRGSSMTAGEPWGRRRLRRCVPEVAGVRPRAATGGARAESGLGGPDQGPGGPGAAATARAVGSYCEEVVRLVLLAVAGAPSARGRPRLAGGAWEKDCWLGEGFLFQPACFRGG